MSAIVCSNCLMPLNGSEGVLCPTCGGDTSSCHEALDQEVDPAGLVEIDILDENDPDNVRHMRVHPADVTRIQARNREIEAAYGRSTPGIAE